MGQRSGHSSSLQLNCDSISFRRADPDGQVTVRHLLLQNDHALVIHPTDPDAVDRHLHHQEQPPRLATSNVNSTLPSYGCQTKSERKMCYNPGTPTTLPFRRYPRSTALR